MKRVYRVTEVAKLFGVRPRTIRQWIQRGELPAAMIAGEWRISVPHLEAMLQAKPARLAQLPPVQVYDPPVPTEVFQDPTDGRWIARATWPSGTRVETRHATPEAAQEWLRRRVKRIKYREGRIVLPGDPEPKRRNSER